MKVDRLCEHCVIVKMRIRTSVARGAGMQRFDRDGRCLEHGETGVEWEEGDDGGSI